MVLTLSLFPLPLIRNVSFEPYLQISHPCISHLGFSGYCLNPDKEHLGFTNCHHDSTFLPSQEWSNQADFCEKQTQLCSSSALIHLLKVVFVYSVCVYVRASERVHAFAHAHYSMHAEEPGQC